MWPAVQVNTPYTAFALLAAAKHNGDFSRAAEDLRTDGYGYEEDELPRSTFLDEPETFLRKESARMTTAGAATEGLGRRAELPRSGQPQYENPPPPADRFRRSDGTSSLYG